jgi:uncharacterized protein YaaR (DUF327 family)
MKTTELLEEVMTEVGQEEENTSLPENVTEAPQDEEHMDLSQVKGYPNWVKTYLNVSDDEGHLLGEIELEKTVKKTCAELNALNIKEVENPEELLQQIKSLSISYSTGINVAENISIGTVTKYRIRLGMLFNFQKTLVKEKLDRNWTVWFAENYAKSLLRSIQDYMRIAEVPNAIRFAVFGKERLIQILKQIGKPTGDDPIGQFLEVIGIEFNPDAETDYQELKIATDIAITRQKLNSEGLEEVADDKIEALVRNGIELTTLRLGQIKLVKETEGNLPDYIDRLIATGGKVEPIQTPETKAKNFKKTVDRFLDQATNALTDDQYLGEFNIELCRQLIEKIQRLEQKLTSTAN